jgi:hypothetical protein
MDGTRLRIRLLDERSCGSLLDTLRTVRKCVKSQNKNQNPPRHRAARVLIGTFRVKEPIKFACHPPKKIVKGMHACAIAPKPSKALGTSEKPLFFRNRNSLDSFPLSSSCVSILLDAPWLADYVF